MNFYKLQYTFSYFNEESEDLIKDCKQDLQDPFNLVTIEVVEKNHISGIITCYRWAESIEELKNTIDHLNDDLVGECYAITSLDGKEKLTDEGLNL